MHSKWLAERQNAREQGDGTRKNNDLKMQVYMRVKEMAEQMQIQTHAEEAMQHILYERIINKSNLSAQTLMGRLREVKAVFMKCPGWDAETWEIIELDSLIRLAQRVTGPSPARAGHRWGGTSGPHHG